MSKYKYRDIKFVIKDQKYYRAVEDEKVGLCSRMVNLFLPNNVEKDRIKSITIRISNKQYAIGIGIKVCSEGSFYHTFTLKRNREKFLEAFGTTEFYLLYNFQQLLIDVLGTADKFYAIILTWSYDEITT